MTTPQFVLSGALAAQLRVTMNCALVMRAWSMALVPELAIVEIEYPPSDSGIAFRVVHVPSGEWVVPLCSALPVARAAFCAVAPLTDWREPWPALQADTEFRRRLTAAQALLRRADEPAREGVTRSVHRCWEAYDILHAPTANREGLSTSA